MQPMYNVNLNILIETSNVSKVILQITGIVIAFLMFFRFSNLRHKRSVGKLILEIGSALELRYFHRGYELKHLNVNSKTSLCNQFFTVLMCSLFIRIALKDDVFKVGSLSDVPLDICFPSLKGIVERKTCECCLYHATTL